MSVTRWVPADCHDVGDVDSLITTNIIDEVLVIAMVANLHRKVSAGVPASHSEHVVLLCKEPRVRDITASWLGRVGLDVDVANTGPAAVECLSDYPHRRQTLITDRVFPPWPGLASISTLKKQLPGLRVIVVQDDGADAVAIAEAAGADAGLTRPLQQVELFRLLDLNEQVG